MTAVQLVRPVRADHQESSRPHVASQECDEVARRAVSPVKVLEDAEDGCPLAEIAQQREHAFEDPRLDPLRARKALGVRASRRPELRLQTTELHRGRRAQGLDVDVAESICSQYGRQSTEGFDERGEWQATA